ncbi:glyoxalase [Alsobacter soli]|uniref:Glyoxalase n=1 Tax=Alsobacter soli TaxID=2109933 RepID=A0A2T1HVM5_9HYPH|nr:VOC family protein [Alsobacter soli]PSC05697.1 glyoxalase [Alsobacter soli]
MLDHASITVSDIPRAERFYDAVMAALGYPKVGARGDWLGYGLRCDSEHPGRSYFTVWLGVAPDPAHGRHLCFKAPSRSAVDAFWRAGLSAGGSGDGGPGLRPHYHPHYYAAFLADPDGNRLEAVCHRALE